MDILFQSKYTRSAHFYHEVYFYNYFKRPFNVMLMLFMGLLLAVNLLFSVMNSWKGIMTNIAVGFGIVFFILYICSYFVELNIAKKRDKEVNSGFETPIYTLSVTEDKIIHSTPSGIEMEIRYAKIPKVLKSKHYIMFMAEDSMVYVMPKDTFTVGDYDGLMKFLQSKNYKV